MGAKGTAIAIGLALVAVGVLTVAAIRFLPGVFDSISNFEFPKFPEFPEFPSFPELPEFPSFPQIPNPFAPNIMQGLPGREFTDSELQAFQFKEAIKRPQILGGATINGQLIQTAGLKTKPGQLIFGSDFASPARLSDLFQRFRATGRLEPGGRERRIAELIARQDPNRLAGIFPSKTNLPQGKRKTAGAFAAAGVRTQVRNILLIDRQSRPSIFRTRLFAGTGARASSKTRSFFQQPRFQVGNVVAHDTAAQLNATRIQTGGRRF